jgi:N-acetylmuramoyl-L-alanine amidase
VLTGVKHPSILVECGFLSHPYEARLVHTESYRVTIAKGITAAVMKYRGAVSKKPAP